MDALFHQHFMNFRVDIVISVFNLFGIIFETVTTAHKISEFKIHSIKNKLNLIKQQTEYYMQYN